MTKAGEIYGRSLYDLAAEEGLSDKILSEMDAVQGIFKENPDYIRLLSEPSIPKKERLKLLDEAFGTEINVYLLNFLKLLTEKGFLREFGVSLKTFRNIYNRDKGIAEAVVISPTGLKDEDRERLKEKLRSITGKSIILTEKKDPQVLGGIKVLVDGKLFDGTVQGRLNELKRRVDETIL